MNGQYTYKMLANCIFNFLQVSFLFLFLFLRYLAAQAFQRMLLLCYDTQQRPCCETNTRGLFPWSSQIYLSVFRRFQEHWEQGMSGFALRSVSMHQTSSEYISISATVAAVHTERNVTQNPLRLPVFELHPTFSRHSERPNTDLFTPKKQQNKTKSQHAELIRMSLQSQRSSFYLAFTWSLWDVVRHNSVLGENGRGKGWR